MELLSTVERVQRESNVKMEMIVYSSAQPGAPPSSAVPPSSWKRWLLGMLLTALLPFLKSRWGPLLKLKKEVDTAVEVAENITEIVEKVAEEVEEVAEEVAEHLPEGSELKRVVNIIENIAEETAKDAQLVDNFIDKVEEVEKEVESSIGAVITRAETDKVEVKTTVKMAENVRVTVGKGSREVEEAAEEVAPQLPEGGKLKQVVGIVENVAKETTTETHRVEEVNDKVGAAEVQVRVKEVKTKVESLKNPVISQADEITENPKDQQ